MGQCRVITLQQTQLSFKHLTGVVKNKSQNGGMLHTYKINHIVSTSITEIVYKMEYRLPCTFIAAIFISPYVPGVKSCMQLPYTIIYIWLLPI